MSVHVHTAKGRRAIGSHLPLNVALAILPTLPRSLLARLVAHAIDRIDLHDKDADLEPEITDPTSGNVEEEENPRAVSLTRLLGSINR